MVAKGSQVESADFTNLLTRINAVLGNGSGQSGYGQRCLSAEQWLSLNDTNTISEAEWNSLRTDINKCSKHQSNSDILATSQATGNIIGADASGLSVTRVTGEDDFTIDTPIVDLGVNDWVAAVGTIEADVLNISEDQQELTVSRAFAESSRTTAWNNIIYAEFEINFLGGYETTDSTGQVVTATNADHARHFFNSGGEIRLSATLSGNTAKDTDWGTMLGNMGTVVFGKEATSVTGTGSPADGTTDIDGDGAINPKIGFYDLKRAYQLIFKKFGSQTEYAENYVEIYAKRNLNSDTIYFKFEFNDADTGDQQPNSDTGKPTDSDPILPPTEAGPGVDEDVLASGGVMRCGLDLRRATGDFVSVPEPDVLVFTELRLT